jgi:hypothetical protein
VRALALITLLGCSHRGLERPPGQESADLAQLLTTPRDLAVVPDLATAPPPCGRLGTPPADVLERAAWGLGADWSGVVHTPWVDPYGVRIAFHPDGSYYAKTLWAPPSIGYVPTPMYYDNDPETGMWRLQGVNGVGEAVGWLTLAWSDYQEPLSEVTVSPDGTHLHFTYYHQGQYGPITYELDCAN